LTFMGCPFASFPCAGHGPRDGAIDLGAGGSH
jgi:hypothetical protein